MYYYFAIRLFPNGYPQKCREKDLKKIFLLLTYTYTTGISSHTIVLVKCIGIGIYW